MRLPTIPRAIDAFVAPVALADNSDIIENSESIESSYRRCRELLLKVSRAYFSFPLMSSK